MKPLVLASSSTFRQQLLKKLQLPFSSVSPDIDESAQENETAIALVERLAIEKAKAGAQLLDTENALVIGSDQVAVIDDQIVGKPLSVDKAIKQLTMASGKSITFYTGLCVFDKYSTRYEALVEPFTVHFKTLSTRQIENYIEKEQPLWCAGSFKCEGLGIALFEKLEGEDPNTLIGLPLIKLIDLLERFDMSVL